jgi:hypothetical protein
MNMNQTAKLGYDTLTCIEKLKIDEGVGLGKGKPDIWFIPNNGQIYHASSGMFREFNAEAKVRQRELVRIIRK